MYNVLKWIEAFALGRAGFDENQIEDIVRAPDLPRNFAESLTAPRAAIFTPHIAAFKELRRNWRDMDGETFAETMTMAHFATYFNGAIQRALFADYERQASGWRDYIFMDTAPNFQNVTRQRITAAGGLYKRGEKGEAKAGHLLDESVTLAVSEYARQFDLSWHVIQSDDLGGISRLPQLMANVAANWLDEFVSSLYDNATTQATLAALGAPWAGTGRLTAANLAIGISDMMTRTDIAGNRISLGSIWLVVPPVLLQAAQTILGNTLEVAAGNGNVTAQFIAGIRVDPYITTSGPDVPWYLFASPNQVPAVTLLRLSGMTGPIVAMKRSNIEQISGNAPSAFLMGNFETGDVEFLVTDIVGGWDDPDYVGVTDYRGLYFSSGTTA